VSDFALVSVILPAHNEEANIADAVRTVQGQHVPDVEVEVIVVDDHSTDQTAARAREAQATVIERADDGRAGSPAAARNLGASIARGDPLVFLDADCIPARGWLEAILAAHARGATMVGGSLEMPLGLSFTARCDYYCGWYLVHPRRPSGWVPHHPPTNLSVRRREFLATSGFTDRPPMEYTNEERIFQGELRRAGHGIYFESDAVAFHYNRAGIRNLFRRNYRWGYTAIESKSNSGAARLAWLYRYPRLLILLGLPMALAHTIFILGQWLRAGRLEPLVMFPGVLASRFAYVLGMTVGGIRWLRSRRALSTVTRSRPRWQ